jgi:hypothetical protein
VESFLTDLAANRSVNVAGAHGVNSKLIRFEQAGELPKTLSQPGRYLGFIRNAADHGIDQEVGTSWEITEATGIEYVFVACSFILATRRHVNGTGPRI